jgi:23S rRNA pseudouridine1911/1915/1917 synthase
MNQSEILNPKFEILYEDNHIIAVNKPSGVLAQADNTGDKPLLELVRDYVKVKYEKPGLVFLGLVHRLDRPVSGVILFARTSKALDRLNAMFKNREMHKTYWAVTRQRPEKESGNLVHWLVKNSEKNITKAYDAETPGGLRAELNYELLGEVEGGYYLIEVNPITGRPHQIRVQLSSMGCPIVGDNKYGYQRANKDKSICLHARKINFIHPVKKEEIEIIAPLPKDGFWPKFSSFA